MKHVPKDIVLWVLNVILVIYLNVMLGNDWLFILAYNSKACFGNIDAIKTLTTQSAVSSRVLIQNADYYISSVSSEDTVIKSESELFKTKEELLASLWTYYKN